MRPDTRTPQAGGPAGRPRIVAHRGCLDGPGGDGENRLSALRRVAVQGFDVEFDVRADRSDVSRLVLSHDPADWSGDRDASDFLARPGVGAFHALNVKELDSLPALCRVLSDAGTQGSFFLFDFELLTEDLPECRRRMRALQDDGFHVASRLSEREPFLEEYLTQPHVSLVWLDEFSGPWVGREHLAALADAGKRAYYVSPDLHGNHDADGLRRRWEQLASWGAAGICTDYPIRLARFLGATR